MRHARAGKKLGRDSAHRKALYSNLAGALITHGWIETTEAKAKAVKPFAEKMITLGKRGDLHARRLAMAELRSNDVVHKLFSDVAPRFADRSGGYARRREARPAPGRRRLDGTARARGLRSGRVASDRPSERGCPTSVGHPLPVSDFSRTPALLRPPTPGSVGVAYAALVLTIVAIVLAVTVLPSPGDGSP